MEASEHSACAEDMIWCAPSRSPHITRCGSRLQLYRAESGRLIGISWKSFREIDEDGTGHLDVEEYVVCYNRAVADTTGENSRAQAPGTHAFLIDPSGSSASSDSVRSSALVLSPPSHPKSRTSAFSSRVRAAKALQPCRVPNA